MPAADRPVPELLAPFARAHLAGLGLTRGWLDHRLETGAVVQPITGVYVGRDRLADDGVRARAAGLALPVGAVLARSTAAWVYGIDTRSPGEREAPLRLECLMRTGEHLAERRGLTVYESTLPDGDVDEVEGALITTPLRTAMDLARYLPPHMGLAVLDAMAADGLVVPREVTIRLGALAGERWTARARYLSVACDARAESYGESWLRLRLLDAGFPAPTPQVWIRDDDGTPLYRLDLAWEERKLAVEYDGLEFHSSPEQRRRDVARREDCARRFGWTVIGVGRGEVLGRSMALELGLGELLGMAPSIRQRAW